MYKYALVKETKAVALVNDLPVNASDFIVVPVDDMAINLSFLADYVYDPATSKLYLPPSPVESVLEQSKASIESMIQHILDEKAQEHGYASVLTAVSYASERSVPKYQHEGVAFRSWRSKVWRHVEQINDDVKSGARIIPTKEELIAELPELVLP